MSPLLANIYMRRFLKAWELRGNDRRFGSRIVNYADDFVILCRGQAAEALAEARQILTRIGLTLNQTKTRICHAWQEPFDFLGYRFGVQYQFGSGRPYLAAYPSAKSVERMKDTLERMIGVAHVVAKRGESRRRCQSQVAWLDELLQLWNGE